LGLCKMWHLLNNSGANLADLLLNLQDQRLPHREFIEKVCEETIQKLTGHALYGNLCFYLDKKGLKIVRTLDNVRTRVSPLVYLYVRIIVNFV